MGPLSKRVLKQIERRGETRRDVAEVIARDCEGEGNVERFSSELEGLTSGREESIAFFFDEPERIEALAKAVDLELELLEELRRAQDAFRVLVIDRALDLATRRYLKRQQTKHDDRFAVIEPEGGAEGAEALRVEALRHRNALVVLSEETDPAIFVEAGLSTTEVYWHRRGYVLSATPNLVPLPPAPPPRLIDDDGVPMVALEEYEQRVLEGKPSAEQRRVQSIVDQGGVPTFRVSEIVLYLAQKHGLTTVRWVPDPSGPSAPPIFESWLAREPETLLWSLEGRLFFVGPDVPEVFEVLRRHHELHKPPSFPRAVSELDELNPFLCVDEEGKPRFGGRWQEVRREVMEECGVDIEGAFGSWRARVEERARPHHVMSQRAPALESKARAALEGLAIRPVSIDVEDAELVFVLRRLVEASLVVFPPEPSDMVHVVAHLGSDRMVWARALAFPSEQPRPLRRVDGGLPAQGYEDALCLDGGDVRLWLMRLTSLWLAGPPEEE